MSDANQRAFFATARERYLIKVRKESVGRGKPLAFNDLTNDEVFGTYRFCNVFREDDKVTRWFRENIRSKMETPVQHVRAAVLFRWFNLPATGELMLPFLLGQEPMEMAYERIRKRADEGKPILNGAYMIKSLPGMCKADGIFRSFNHGVEDGIAMLTHSIQLQNTLEHAVSELCMVPYLGPFMAYQSVCDLRFTPVLEHAADVNYWTSPGPGSARGLGRIFHDDAKAYNYNSSRDRPVLIDKMRYLLELSRMPDQWPVEWPRWELSTVQHWACEFDKYMRVKTGEGTPKQKYRPA